MRLTLPVLPYSVGLPHPIRRPHPDEYSTLWRGLAATPILSIPPHPHGGLGCHTQNTQMTVAPILAHTSWAISLRGQGVHTQVTAAPCWRGWAATPK